MGRIKIHGFEVESVPTGSGMTPIPADTTAPSIVFPVTDGNYGFGVETTTSAKIAISIPSSGNFLALQLGGVNRVLFSASGGNNIIDSFSSNLIYAANIHQFNTGGSERMRVDSSGGLSIGSLANAAATSILDITSTTKGVLVPRMTTTQRDAISSPATGLIIFNTTTNKINVRGASAWEAVTSV